MFACWYVFCFMFGYVLLVARSLAAVVCCLLADVVQCVLPIVSWFLFSCCCLMFVVCWLLLLDVVRCCLFLYDVVVRCVFSVVPCNLCFVVCPLAWFVVRGLLLCDAVCFGMLIGSRSLSVICYCMSLVAEYCSLSVVGIWCCLLLVMC